VTTTLLRGGRVRAGDGSPATALLTDGTVVAWLGRDDEADGLRDSADVVVDLDGALVTPAFVDAHVHTTSTGLVLDGLDLTGCRSLAEALDQVRRFAGRRPVSGVLLGHGWDETRWPEHRPPTRAELDRAAGDHAVYLTRVDVHSAVASSALVATLPEVAGLDGWSSDGPLTRDAHHAARAAALDRVSPDQRERAQRATLRRCAELGIGLVHELGGPEISSPSDFASVLGLAADPDAGGPDVVGYWGERGGVERARELGALGAAGDLFADGALGSHTAYLREVYADLDDRGAGYLTAAQVRDHVVACTAAGLQAGFHVIGDAALDTVLAGFTEAAQVVGVAGIRAARHRLEHAEMTDAGHLATMARLGLVASVQPVFDALWGGPAGLYVERLGVDRAAPMNPFAAMAAAGIALALGSDSPVTPLGGWGAVRAAVEHRTAGSGLTTAMAFAAHTAGGWYAAGVDDGGVLAPGRPATYAVWAVDEPDGSLGLPELGGGRPDPVCVRTVVRGRTVHDLLDAPREEASG
jgi:predicted amidohydrolase YtcJ